MNTFVHDKRKTFSARERAELFAACGGQCANCQRRIRHGEDWDVDHIIALARGGTNEPSNLQVLCVICHGAKTTDDVTEIAKGKRIAIKSSVPKRFQKARGWRR